MNDPGPMRLFNCCTDLFENVDHPRNRKPPFLRNDFSQRAAIEILHHEIGDWTIRCVRDTEVSDVNNVWMSQSACRFRFTSKPRDKLIVRRELRMDNFERHGTFRAEMRSAIDRAHSSLSEELFDLIFVIERVHVWSKNLQLSPNSYRLFAVYHMKISRRTLLLLLAGAVTSYAQEPPGGLGKAGSSVIASQQTKQDVAPPRQPALGPDYASYSKNPTFKKLRILAKPEAGYTDEARRNNVSGQVVLRVLFGETGSIHQISVIKFLPFGLTERAIAAARQIEFEPAELDGRKVAYPLIVVYNFRRH